MTHAFFKALLFLCAGSVIHAVSDEQDMRKMGGLARLIPWTCVLMWIGSLALAGIPPFAGYYSKDAIIAAAYASGTGIGMYGFICTVLAAFLTAFYSWRLLIMTFHGRSRVDHHVLEHVHESPPVMIVPLLFLATGAVIAGKLLGPLLIGDDWQAFWSGSIFNAPANHVLADLETVPAWAEMAPLVFGLAGIALAYVMYMVFPLLPMQLAAKFRSIYLLLLNKWYVDELYDTTLVQPMIRLARAFWQTGDATLIDGVPNGLAELAVDGSRQAVKIQTGSLAMYAFVMLIGVVLLVGLFLLSR
jgi:NADH-quinone oxidoreductase subunit L